MEISVEDVIETVADELRAGHLGESADALHIRRTGPGSLLLDYGDAGRFSLVVSALDPD